MLRQNAEDIISKIYAVSKLNDPLLQVINKEVCLLFGKLSKPVPDYTRSRNILKSLRLEVTGEDSKFVIIKYKNSYKCEIWDSTIVATCDNAFTEELAELGAILDFVRIHNELKYKDKNNGNS